MVLASQTGQPLIRQPAILLALLFVLSAPVTLHAESYTLIVCGSGGEEPFKSQFAEWGQRFRTALIDQCGHNSDKIVLLTESGDQPGVTAPSHRESVLSRLRDLGVQTQLEDQLFIILIGHGSYRHGEAKLNVPGPDLTAADLALTLERVRTKRVTIVNTASASAPFVNALSAPDRIICTSTRNRDQVNATRFAESLIQALEDGSSDQNRDERISVWEAAQQAASITASWYAGQKLVASEQAILDDNGDGKGSRLYVEEKSTRSSHFDGGLAKRTYLKDVHFPAHIPESWVRDYRSAIERVEDWVAQKAVLDSVRYVEGLESLLIDAAVVNRRIRG
jgi:hypothetical protein